MWTKKVQKERRKSANEWGGDLCTLENRGRKKRLSGLKLVIVRSKHAKPCNITNHIKPMNPQSSLSWKKYYKLLLHLTARPVMDTNEVTVTVTTATKEKLLFNIL